MKKILNPQTTLLAVGILQPTNAQEVRGVLDTIFRDGGTLPSVSEIDAFLVEQLQHNRIVRLNDYGPAFYSLTISGSLYLTADQRKVRDKFRAYLLRDAHRARFIESRGVVEKDLVGDPPTLDTSSTVKGRAANRLGRTAFGRRIAYGQPYWPRISRQFIKRTGQARSPRDTFPNFISFESESQFEVATGRTLQWDYLGLGTCLGISPQLIWNISHQINKHYRSFNIPKKGGGDRLIETPRVFLKVIQWFLADFVLDDLVQHEAVHSFSFKRSIATNAASHVGARYVGNVDIENFFGSITFQQVTACLTRNGFNSIEADVIAKLCMKDGRLPQGAPSSPLLSNAIIFSFDTAAQSFCRQYNLNYTRYADDVTISGHSSDAVRAALNQIPMWLEPYGLKLNEKKSRIASSHGQQKVAGVVVNSFAAPPRVYRRSVRAMFHNAMKDRDTDALAKLGGALGYLKIFPQLRDSSEIKAYEVMISQLQELRRSL